MQKSSMLQKLQKGVYLRYHRFAFPGKQGLVLVDLRTSKSPQQDGNGKDQSLVMCEWNWQLVNYLIILLAEESPIVFFTQYC